MSYARDERAAMSRLLDSAGPDAPTLCEGWRTRDLAAHLVLRERRPDAAVGLMGGPLAAHARRVQASIASTPYPVLVEQFRSGPPRLSPWAVPGVDERLNLVEFFVHHEDVRRAAGMVWEPRDLGPGLTEALWQRLRLAKLVFRRVRVGVELVRDDLPSIPGRRQVRITARARTPVVTVTGHPAELTLWTLGRTEAARVRLDGSEADVRLLTETSWNL